MKGMRVGRAVVPTLMVAYGIAAFAALSLWFPLTGSTPIWFPTLVVGLGIVILWVAVGVARDRRWALVPAVALSLIALAWTATWLDETLPPLSLKVFFAGVPLTVIAYAVIVVRQGRRRSLHNRA